MRGKLLILGILSAGLALVIASPVSWVGMLAGAALCVLAVLGAIAWMVGESIREYHR